MTCDGRRVRLHELTAAPGVHLLLASDARPVDVELLGEYVHVHRLSSWRGHGILAVRPDGYVGFRSATVDHEMIRRWLTLLALYVALPADRSG